MKTPLRIAWCLGTAMVFFSVSAHADWLVTTTGGRVETKGPWQVKGRLIVFTTSAGVLSSLRASDVDLQASAQATTTARALASAPQPAPPLPKAAVLVLTDADVGHVTDSPLSEAADAVAAADAAGSSAPTAPADGALSVAAWEQVPMEDDGGIEIFGSLQNGSAETATDIALTVRLLDEQGTEVATAPATVTARVLPPGNSINFRVAFPGIISFQTARFTISSRGFVTQPRGTPEPPAQS